MKQFFARVGYALNGWKTFFAHETNGRIQGLISILVLAAAAGFQVQPWEWAAILLCIGLVLGLEMLNSALEELANTVHPNFSKGIGRVKDMAAGAVLWVSVISVITGAIIFLPYIKNSL